MSLENLIKKFEALSLNKVVKDSLQGQEQFIKRLNTITQLFNQGINSDGIKLDVIGGPYTPFTIDKKSNEGQPTDRITLLDTGEFYASFNVRIGNAEFEITANTIKDEDDLTDRYGEKIIGLTEESLDKLRNVILPKIQEGFRKAIL